MPRLSLWQSMTVLAALAVCLALLRANLALGIIWACVSSMTLVRTAGIVQGRQGSKDKASVRRWLCTGSRSLIVSSAIILSADVTFLFVYYVAEGLELGKLPGAPHAEPEVDWGAVGLGIPAALAVGCMIRCHLWIPGSKPGDPFNAEPPRGNPGEYGILNLLRFEYDNRVRNLPRSWWAFRRNGKAPHEREASCNERDRMEQLDRSWDHA
jgi:hypothetical protein